MIPERTDWNSLYGHYVCVLAGYIMEEKKLVGRKNQSYWDKECPGKTWYRVEEFKDGIG